MEQKKKSASHIAELTRLHGDCGFLLSTASNLDIGVPAERQLCREHMSALRSLLTEMKLMSIQVEIYLAEYSDLTEATNDDKK